MMTRDAQNEKVAPIEELEVPSVGQMVKVYKTVGEARLRLHIFSPTDLRQGDRRAAIVFFFGGGWVGGNPRQFFPHCQYFSSRGMVAISAEYRVRSRHGTTPFECVTDAKSAVRWVRAHAAELGIDPRRIAAGGGSAGGHIAACAGLVPGLEEQGEDTAVSSVPNALVLFNPPTDVSRWEERIGKRWREISPAHHVHEDAPPAIIFHGTADTTVPIEDVRQFCEKMRAADNRCELMEFENRPHAFFNYGKSKEDYAETVRQADRFLASLGFLQGDPTLADGRL